MPKIQRSHVSVALNSLALAFGVARGTFGLATVVVLGFCYKSSCVRSGWATALRQGMALHILKMAVGVENVEHLCRLQTQRLRVMAEAGDPQVLRHWTRNTPKRVDEIQAGGSLYWIIKGYVRARQRIVAIERSKDREASKKCAFVLDPTVVRTLQRSARPIQGWRYLDSGSAPVDEKHNPIESVDIPEEMARELRSLGLI